MGARRRHQPGRRGRRLGRAVLRRHVRRHALRQRQPAERRRCGSTTARTSTPRSRSRTFPPPTAAASGWRGSATGRTPTRSRPTSGAARSRCRARSRCAACRDGVRLVQSPIAELTDAARDGEPVAITGDMRLPGSAEIEVEVTRGDWRRPASGSSNAGRRGGDRRRRRRSRSSCSSIAALAARRRFTRSIPASRRPRPLARRPSLAARALRSIGGRGVRQRRRDGDHRARLSDASAGPRRAARRSARRGDRGADVGSCGPAWPDDEGMAQPLYGAVEAGGTKFVCMVGTGPGDVREQVRFRHDDARGDAAGDAGVSSRRAQARMVRSPRSAIASFGPVDLARGLADLRLHHVDAEGRAGPTSTSPARCATRSACRSASTPTSTPRRSANGAGARRRGSTPSST